MPARVLLDDHRDGEGADLPGTRPDLLTVLSSGLDSDRALAQRCWHLAPVNRRYEQCILVQQQDPARCRRLFPVIHDLLLEPAQRHDDDVVARYPLSPDQSGSIVAEVTGDPFRHGEWAPTDGASPDRGRTHYDPA